MADIRPLMGVLALATIGCKAPPEAPTELEGLCSYLYDHAWDDDTEALEAGVQNLSTWLETGGNLDSTLEGYQISALDEEALIRLQDHGFEMEPNVDALVGAAVGNESAFKGGDLAEALVLENQADVFPKNYNWYEREYFDDPECFPGRKCEEVQASATSESSWAGLVTVETTNHIQYRWVDVEDIGWTFVQRSWLIQPADISWEELQVNAQYFMAVTVPQGNGSLRVQATWIDADYGALPVSEDFAKQQVVNSMQKQGEVLEEWLEAR